MLLAVVRPWNGSDGSPPVDAQPTVAASASTSPPATAAAPDTRASSDVEKPAPTTQGAVAQLHAAVSAAASSGELQGTKEGQLQKRVDDLAQRVTTHRGKDPGRQLESFEKYLEKLTSKGDLSRAGQQRIQAALGALQPLVPR